MTDPAELALSAAGGGVTVGVLGLMIAGWQRLFGASQGMNDKLIARTVTLETKIDALFAARAADRAAHDTAMREVQEQLRACEDRDHKRSLEVQRLSAEVQRYANPSNGHTQ